MRSATAGEVMTEVMTDDLRRLRPEPAGGVREGLLQKLEKRVVEQLVKRLMGWQNLVRSWRQG